MAAEIWYIDENLTDNFVRRKLSNQMANDSINMRVTQVF